MLMIYNTLTRTKEEFKPLQPPTVKMYCCGPTVWNFVHVGNFRGPIFYNLLRNWLEHIGHKVIMVCNYTDVDDKIIQAAQKDGSTAAAIAEKYLAEFESDFRHLKLRPHNANPRVSETMEEIVKMIAELIRQEKAYVTASSNEGPSETWDVWYSIKTFPEYGKLSHRQVDDLRSGVRIDLTEREKKDPLDFALWKGAKQDEPSWDSPWGKGRPGWHIECSAMVKHYLGEEIDIHGGGLDLMFPHHENEIAQSEGCTGKRLATYWVHHNMINLSGAKMSKSIGNVITARRFMDQYNPEILKFLMLSSHYRSVLDLQESSIDQAIRSLARVYSALALADRFLKASNLSQENSLSSDPSFSKKLEEAMAKITAALNDDLNTPLVMATIFDLIRQFNSQMKWGVKITPTIFAKARNFKNFILKVGNWMSLFQEPADVFLGSLDDRLLKAQGLNREVINSLINKRMKAREEKDFSRADELRDELLKMGISVMDSPEGSVWEVIK